MDTKRAYQVTLTGDARTLRPVTNALAQVAALRGHPTDILRTPLRIPDDVDLKFATMDETAATPTARVLYAATPDNGKAIWQSLCDLFVLEGEIEPVMSASDAIIMLKGRIDIVPNLDVLLIAGHHDDGEPDEVPTDKTARLPFETAWPKTRFRGIDGRMLAVDDETRIFVHPTKGYRPGVEIQFWNWELMLGTSRKIVLKGRCHAESAVEDVANTAVAASLKYLDDQAARHARSARNLRSKT